MYTSNCSSFVKFNFNSVYFPVKTDSWLNKITNLSLQLRFVLRSLGISVLRQTDVVIVGLLLSWFNYYRRVKKKTWKPLWNENKRFHVRQLDFSSQWTQQDLKSWQNVMGYCLWLSDKTCHKMCQILISGIFETQHQINSCWNKKSLIPKNVTHKKMSRDVVLRQVSFLKNKDERHFLIRSKPDQSMLNSSCWEV